MEFQIPIAPVEYILTICSGNNPELQALMKNFTSKYCRVACSKQISNIFRVYSLKEFKLERLFIDCCDSDEQKFETTLALLSCNKIEPQRVVQNLNLPNPVPFIKGEVPDEFKESLDVLLTDPNKRQSLYGWAEDISKGLIKDIKDRHDAYVASLQLN